MQRHFIPSTLGCGSCFVFERDSTLEKGGKREKKNFAVWFPVFILIGSDHNSRLMSDVDEGDATRHSAMWGTRERRRRKAEKKSWGERMSARGRASERARERGAIGLHHRSPTHIPSTSTSLHYLHVNDSSLCPAEGRKKAY